MATNSETKENHSLVADIGGTNARLQLIKFSKGDSKPVEIQSTFYKTADFPDFRGCVKDFLKKFEGTEQYPVNATLAVAAAPFNNKLKMVNCHWPEIDGDQLGKELNIWPFRLINDFEAIGYSLLKLPQETLLQLNEVKPFPGKPMAVVGSGTGLGECVLNPAEGADGKISYFVCPTEGGHKDFAPTDQIDFDYLQYNLKEIPEVKEFNHLSTERAFCGPAIPVMYKFFCQREGIEPKEISSKDIFQIGLKKEDPICEKVLHFYARLLGKELSNFALDCLPYSGLFIVGNIINSIAKFFTEEETKKVFFDAYFSKDKVTNNVLSRFPIYIVKEEELGLLGAFVKAQIDTFGQ